jgi:hypothetical protein
MCRIEVVDHREHHGTEIAIDQAMRVAHSEISTILVATGIYDDVDQ